MELLLPTVLIPSSTSLLAFTFQYGATSTKINSNYAERKSTFTFQYGATSTLNIFTRRAILNVFTFQYGATSTVSLLNLNISITNLHSNMELLLRIMIID